MLESRPSSKEFQVPTPIFCMKPSTKASWFCSLCASKYSGVPVTELESSHKRTQVLCKSC